MKTGILTITPNIGFGGMLQAYALQTLLGKLTGGEVEIINYRGRPGLISRLAFMKNSLMRWLTRREFVKFTPEAAYEFMSSRVEPFHRRFLRWSEPVNPGREFAELVNDRYDTVVVGSDQVWRPKYVLSIADYFLQGVSPRVRKVAYAASLGASEWEFDAEQTRLCSELLSGFSYVSVRESDGAELVRRNLNPAVEVFNDLDPTLMVPVETYDPLSLPAKPGAEPYLFAYILDPTLEKKAIVMAAAAHEGLPMEWFNSGAENPALPLKDRVAPAVEDWISGIRNSSMVVTDSFHGCVFAIIFNKPFLVYVNRARGMSRFNSLLQMLGLSDRMVCSGRDCNFAVLDTPIDWDKVNSRLAREREAVTARLKQVFSPKHETL